MPDQPNIRPPQQRPNDRTPDKNLTDEQVSTMGIQIGEDLWLVEMSDISEVLPLPPITTVPFTKRWYCGVANVRGNVYSVVDLAAFMGHAEVLHDGRDRVLLVAQKFAFNAGLLVNRVLGLRNVRTWNRSEADGKVQYQDPQGQMWQQLNVPKLLQQPDFLHVES